ncbi:MAG: hypothetical protein QM831_25455 [Kofleriaceae bacterium]
MMKFILGGVLLASAAASAEPLALGYVDHSSQSGMFVDFGLGAERLSPGNGNTYSADFVRFAPQAMITRHFYLGAEVDFGNITGMKPHDSSSTSRTTDGSDQMSTVLSEDHDGSIAAGKALFGFRATAGVFSGAVELAPTFRLTTLQHSATATSSSSDQAAVEAHGRLDFWLSPVVTVGAWVGVDLGSTDNIQAALQVGFHFERTHLR